MQLQILHCLIQLKSNFNFSNHLPATSLQYITLADEIWICNSLVKQQSREYDYLFIILWSKVFWRSHIYQTVSKQVMFYWQEVIWGLLRRTEPLTSVPRHCWADEKRGERNTSHELSLIQPTLLWCQRQCSHLEGTITFSSPWITDKQQNCMAGNPYSKNTIGYQENKSRSAKALWLNVVIIHFEPSARRNITSNGHSESYQWRNGPGTRRKSKELADT